ncbi:MAG: GNAT family N-acetyltransferase [Longimicrobiales bacterium]
MIKPTAPRSAVREPTGPAGDRSLTIVTDPAELDPLLGAWGRLSAGHPAGPFATHAWNREWLRGFQHRYDSAWVVVQRCAGEIAAIAPLVTGKESFAGFPVRCVRFIGARDSCQKSFLLGEPAGPFVEAVVEQLLARASTWDTMVLDDISPDSTWLRPFRDACKEGGLYVTEAADSVNRYLELPTDYEAFHSALKRNLKRNLKRRSRQLSMLGEIGFERYSGTACTLGRLEKAVRIEAASWKGREGIGVFQVAGGCRFHRGLLEAPERGFDLDLAFLTVDKQPIAFQYGFVQENRYYAYTTSFDEDYRPYSPGILLMDHLIQRLIQDGVKKLDLLVGEAPYKSDLTDSFTTNLRLTVFNKTPYGHTLRRLHSVKDRVWPHLKTRMARRAPLPKPTGG